jgi:hypothetical protein
MKIRSSPISEPQPGKNGLRLSLISHDLSSAYILATPQNSLLRAHEPGHREEVELP